MRATNKGSFLFFQILKIKLVQYFLMSDGLTGNFQTIKEVIKEVTHDTQKQCSFRTFGGREAMSPSVPQFVLPGHHSALRSLLTGDPGGDCESFMS